MALQCIACVVSTTRQLESSKTTSDSGKCEKKVPNEAMAILTLLPPDSPQINVGVYGLASLENSDFFFAPPRTPQETWAQP